MPKMPALPATQRVALADPLHPIGTALTRVVPLVLWPIFGPVISSRTTSAPQSALDTKTGFQNGRPVFAYSLPCASFSLHSHASQTLCWGPEGQGALLSSQGSGRRFNHARRHALCRVRYRGHHPRARRRVVAPAGGAGGVAPALRRKEKRFRLAKCR